MKKPAVIVDVRTPEEFALQSIENSINIPLQEISNRVGEILELPMPIALCCAAGVRSEYAYQYLSKLGVDCYNGGSWMEVQQSLNE